MRKADKNADNKMTLKELKHFLRQVNVEVDDTYAAEIFKVSHSILQINVLSISVVWLIDRLIVSYRNATRPTRAPWRARRSSTSTTC